MRLSGTGGTNPEWSDDGKSVYFLSTEPVTEPQVITIGLNWTSALKKAR